MTSPIATPLRAALRGPPATPVATAAARAAICILALAGSDVLAMAACAALGIPSGGGALRTPMELAPPGGALLIYLAATGRYTARAGSWTEATRVVAGGLFAIVLVALAGRWAGKAAAAHAAAMMLTAFIPLSLAGNRLAKAMLARAGLWTVPVLLVGHGELAAEAGAALAADPSLGLSVVAQVRPAELLPDAPAGGTEPVLAPLMERHRARMLLVALDADDRVQRRMIDCALRQRVPFAVAPAFGCAGFDWTPLRFFGRGTALLHARGGLARPSARLAKACLDLPVAALLLLLLLPLLLLLAAACRLDGGPALFAHRRVGAGGRMFDCLKFRTMHVDADRILHAALAADPVLAAEWAATRKLVRDPRVTRLGGLLRRTSLDELPQLINVLRLEMSLVGPRPIVPAEIPFYGADIARYQAALPGITGVWQVSGRSATSYRRRVELDVWYVDNWSLSQDIAVLARTIPAVLSRRGAC